MRGQGSLASSVSSISTGLYLLGVTAHLGRPGVDILGRSLSDVGERGCTLGSDLGAPDSVLFVPSVTLVCAELRVTK